MLYVLAVTDGSAQCNIGIFRTENIKQTEANLSTVHQEHGPRPFWKKCKELSTIDQFMRICQNLAMVGYLLDGQQWTKYYPDESGEYKWAEFGGNPCTAQQEEAPGLPVASAVDGGEH